MITAYRIFQTTRTSNWMDGEGAFRYGGRWNSRGVRVLYASASLALSALEVLVHLDDEEILVDYSYATIRFDLASVKNVEDLASLPPNWREYPAPIALRRIGDDWARKEASPVLRVPTAVLPIDFNYILNLEHPAAAGAFDFGDADRFVFDHRLTERRNKKL